VYCGWAARSEPATSGGPRARRKEKRHREDRWMGAQAKQSKDSEKAGARMRGMSGIRDQGRASEAEHASG